MTGRCELPSRMTRLSLGFLSLLGAALPSLAEAEEDVIVPLFRYVPQTLTDANRARVADLYDGMCAGCHVHGEGQDNGLALYGAKHPELDAAAIHYGRVEPIPKTAYAEPVVMPPFGNRLTPVQIGELVAYIMTFRAPWPPR